MLWYSIYFGAIAKLSKESLHLLSNRPYTSQPLFSFPSEQSSLSPDAPSWYGASSLQHTFCKARQSQAPPWWDSKANSQSILVHKHIPGDRTHCQGSHLLHFCMSVQSESKKLRLYCLNLSVYKKPMFSDNNYPQCLLPGSDNLTGALPTFSLSFPGGCSHGPMFLM